MKARESPSIPTVEAAIERVLEAEREARTSIDAAREEAAARVVDARARALAIVGRAEKRILAARQGVESRIARRQAQVDEAARLLREGLQPADRGEGDLKRAIEAVAAALTGESAR